MDELCYLGGMLSSERGSDHAIVNRVGSAQGTIRELQPILCGRCLFNGNGEEESL
jgi:hypothetical protein